MEAPCLFFETSTDEGQHWMRHHVPVTGGFDPQRVQLSGDPSHPGRYTVGVLTPARTSFLIFVTGDSGATWSEPVTIRETVPGVNFKAWMAYGPTGVLGLVWKKRRDDLTPSPPPPTTPPTAFEAAFDVYSALSCDGGMTWLTPVRVNGETSPAGSVGFDDFTYIALDAKYAHLVWGDRRLQPKVNNAPGGIGGTQAYYGRVPFSAVTGGERCGG